MFKDKIILITGGSGSWGNELTKQLLLQDPKEIRIYSRGEFAQVTMKRKFNDNRLKFIIGDVRNTFALNKASENVDYIFHLAALKHVPICEEYHRESIDINILGSRNVIDAAINNKVKKVIDVSTDKACSPFNFYGHCKAIAESEMILSNNDTKDTKFICVRAGNVMGSNGSIIPFFKQLILEGKDVPITDPEMTRYIMSLPDAINLLLFAAEKGYGGEIFVVKMKACKIIDLANAMIKHYKSKVNTKIIGIRPGEKLHEMLVSEYESPTTVEMKDFRVILPMTSSLIHNYYEDCKDMEEKVYTSNQNLLTQEEIIEELKRADLL